MSWMVIVPAIAAALVGLFLLNRPRFTTAETSTTLDGIHSVYKSLKSTGSDGSFAALVPPSDGEDALNIQFSIEDGSIGLDWVMLSSVNVRDKDSFVALLNRKRVRYTDKKRNGVHYLRTTDNRAPDICKQVLAEMYHVPNNVDIVVIQEGWSWVPKDG